MKKAIGYLTIFESDESDVLSRFPNFDYYVNFVCTNGFLTKAIVREKRGAKFSDLSIPICYFDCNYNEFYQSVCNLLKTETISLYLLKMNELLIDKIYEQTTKYLETYFIDSDGHVTLLNGCLDNFNITRPLVELVVAREENIKIEIYTNEMCGFEEPHVHVSADNKLCKKISLLDGFKTLHDYSKVKSKMERKIMEIIQEYIVFMRLKWNEFSNRVKFKVDDNGVPTSETYKTEQNKI